MDISLNSVDDATLEYMVNVAQYEKYLRKNNIDYDTGFKRDLKFYRKRIISQYLYYSFFELKLGVFL